MRPKSQLVLKDAALSKPSAFVNFSESSRRAIPFPAITTSRRASRGLSISRPISIRGLRQALEARGIDKLYSHQARVVRAGAKRQERRCRHADGVRKNALLQPAGAAAHRRESRCARPVPLSDEGAHLRPARRPDAVGERLIWPEAAISASIPTTAIRRRMRAPPYDRAATSFSAIRTCSTRASCRTTRSGRKLFENLQFIVLDELHTYRGVFGSHVANLFRRLARICEFYGSKPQFICTSATIANPQELAEKLTGQPFEFIRESGAGEGEKHVFFYNPPVVNRQLGIRRSYVKEAQHIAAAFLKRNIPAIVFANSRLITEILVRYLKEALEHGAGAGATSSSDIAAAILPNERRQIERGLRDGRIRGVVSTNALELGHRYRQSRCGRAGRLSGNDCFNLAAHGTRRPSQRNVGGGAGGVEHAARSVHRESSGIFSEPAAGNGTDQSGQHSHPDQSSSMRRRSSCRSARTNDSAGTMFRRFWSILPSAASFIAPATSGTGRAMRIRRIRSRCEASARTISSLSKPPASIADHRRSGLHERLLDAAREGDLSASGPAVLRSSTRYPGAPRVREAGRFGLLHRCDHLHESENPRNDGDRREHNHGEVHVAHQVVGFKKLKFFTMENVGSGDLNLPVQEMHTTSYWITIPRDVFESLPYSPTERLNGLHGLAYALAHLSCVFLMCDRRDVGSAVDAGVETATFHPTIFIYDNFPGGIGLSRPLYEIRDQVLAATEQLIRVVLLRRRLPVLCRADGEGEGSGAGDSGRH